MINTVDCGWDSEARLGVMTVIGTAFDNNQ